MTCVTLYCVLYLAAADLPPRPTEPTIESPVPKAAAKDHWYKDKYFWTGTTIIGAGVSLDGASTSWGQQNALVEGNPLLGKHPSNGELIGFGAAGFGGYFVGNILAYKLTHHSPSRFKRQLGRWGVPAAAAAIHLSCAIDNYGYGDEVILHQNEKRKR